MGPEKIALLENSIKNLETQKLDLFKLAQDANLEDFYLRYADLSNNAVHANLRTANERLVVDEKENVGIKAGPNGMKHVDSTIGDGALFLLNSTEIFYKAYKLDLPEDFDRLIRLYNNQLNALEE